MRVTVELPTFVRVGDYHDFRDFQDKLSVLIPGVKVQEIGYGETVGGYIGIVYIGRRPTTAAIRGLLKQHGINLEW